MKPSRCAHPFLFAVFPVLFLFAHNADQLAWPVIVPPLLATLGAAAVVWGVLRWALRDAPKAAVLTSMFLIWFFSYGAVRDLCYLHLQMRGAVLLPLWGVLLLGAGAAALRARGGLEVCSRILTVIGGTLTAISLATALTPSLHAASRSAGTRPLPRLAHAAARPDIYYIVLDSYAGEHTLEEFYHFRNDRFLRNLQARGFYVAGQSRSNYAFTLTSMSSALSMDYLTGLARQAGPDSRDLTPLRVRIEDNPVAQALEADGYRYCRLGFQPGRQFQDLSYLLLKMTPLGSLYDGLVAGDSRRMTLSTLQALETVPQGGPPVFVYAHILCPHEPYVFGPDGRRPEPASVGTDVETRKRLYVDQMVYLNGRVERALDRILARSAKPPIIIIQADHGPRNLALDTPTPLCVAERMRILNAYYLPGQPGQKARGLYPRITPVNSFRVVFNDYFGGHYPLLKDESFFSTYAAPYSFVNVSARVRDQYPVGWDRQQTAGGGAPPASAAPDPD